MTTGKIIATTKTVKVKKKAAPKKKATKTTLVTHVKPNVKAGNKIDHCSSEYDAAFEEEDKPLPPSHEDNADALVMPNLVSNRPGPLRTKGNITLHTRSAHRLFYGRQKNEAEGLQPITGLVRFALNMKQLSQCAANNDPYADATLLTVEEKLSVTKKYVAMCIKELEQVLDDMEDIKINFHQSVKPVEVPLEFKTTYGFVAARLISQYDKLVRLALTARHVGLIFSDDWGRFNGRSARMIRDAFHASSAYRFTGVARDDIAANNRVAQAAVLKYGELPQYILDGSKRGIYAPDIKKLANKQKQRTGATMYRR